MTTPHEPYTERHLSLVREAEGADGHTYCPPLQAPMSVQQRHALGNASPYGITDANAPRVLRAIFEEPDSFYGDYGVSDEETERKMFGAAIMVWACIMGAVIGGAYLVAWLR